MTSPATTSETNQGAEAASLRQAEEPTPRVVDFDGLQIAYDERVLVPRAWTAAQSRWLAEVVRPLPPGPLLELCTGVGHIGLLAASLTGRDAVLVDAGEVACDFAERNAAANPGRGTVQVLRRRVEELAEGGPTFAGILADPPWVPSAQTGRFPEDPLVAIDGGADGLALARECVEVIDRRLAPWGVAVLQLGTRAQAEALLAGRAAGSGDGHGLEAVDVREHGERGVLVLLTRPG